jgi:hypothetical protein
MKKRLYETDYRQVNETDLPIEKIVSVYLGKANTCMCGCSGDYAYTKYNQKYGSKNRGYKVTDDECSDRKVKMRLKRFFENPDDAEVIDNYIFTKYFGDRQITVYLKEE